MEGENRNTILTSLTGNAATGDITFTANDDKTELATNVVNNKGSELPSTGGMGTTIFYVVGSILVLGAAILLITKKLHELHANCFVSTIDSLIINQLNRAKKLFVREMTIIT